MAPATRRFLADSLLLALVTRASFLVIAVLSGRIFLESKAPLGALLAEVLVRWDGLHYLHLAEYGYRAGPDWGHAFIHFPLFPGLIRLVHLAVPGWTAAGLVAALLAAVAGGTLLQRLVALDGDQPEARRALELWMLFPSAYALIAPMSDGLCLAATAGALLSARQGRWAWCGLAAMAATLSRPTGALVVPALLVEAWVARPRPPLRSVAWLLLAAIGLGAFLAMSTVLADDPLAFLRSAGDNYAHRPVWPWEPIADAWRSLRSPPSGHRIITADALLPAALLPAALLLVSARWLRPSYQLFGWLSLLAPLVSAFPIALPRYLLNCLPLFVILARLGRRPALHQALLAAFASLFGALSFLYARGYYVP